MNAPLTAAADPRRVMPGTPVARLDAVRGAIASLEHERRRLERLGLELPLARCEQQLRYWRFLDGLMSVAAGQRAADSGGAAWPGVAIR